MKKYYTITKCGTLKLDKYATWVNNSRWSWLIPVLCVLVVGIIEAL